MLKFKMSLNYKVKIVSIKFVTFLNNKKMLKLFLKDEYIFTKFYKNNKWADQESKSGDGSSKKNTSSVRKIIPVVIKKYSIKTFFDVPCGDFNWMKLVNLKECDYIGGDIVRLIISKNNEKFSNPKRLFINYNMITNIPSKVDLIFCRDAYLSNNTA